MRLLGAGLIVCAGLWGGLLAAGALTCAVERCGSWCVMLELLSFELSRFRTPLPELFASLGSKLNGAPGTLCRGVCEGLNRVEDEFRVIWSSAMPSGLSDREREILLPLGEVLGRFGADEQAAMLSAALERMNALCAERRMTLRDRKKLCVCSFSAGGIFLAVLLI